MGSAENKAKKNGSVRPVFLKLYTLSSVIDEKCEILNGFLK
jgi:hypothetical protein